MPVSEGYLAWRQGPFRVPSGPKQVTYGTHDHVFKKCCGLIAFRSNFKNNELCFKPTIQDSGKLRNLIVFLVAAVFSTVIVPGSVVSSDTVRIVAIGASNTNGKGVGRRSAWPAQLANLLQQKGYAVKVVNKGVNGNTTAQMLSRLKRAVGSKTRIAILSIPLTNDRQSGTNTKSNVASMKAILKEKGIGAIVIDRPHKWAGNRLQSDGIHFTVAGHKAVAAKLLSKTISQISRLK